MEQTNPLRQVVLHTAFEVADPNVQVVTPLLHVCVNIWRQSHYCHRYEGRVSVIIMSGYEREVDA